MPQMHSQVYLLYGFAISQFPLHTIMKSNISHIIIQPGISLDSVETVFHIKKKEARMSKTIIDFINSFHTNTPLPPPPLHPASFPPPVEKRFF